MGPNTAVRSEGTPFYAKLLTAGAAGCIADFATFPFDTAKVRLQVRFERFFLSINKIIIEKIHFFFH